MTPVLIIVLAVSIVGMVLLIMLKRWELATGRILGGRARPAVGAAAARSLSWAELVLPSLIREWAGSAGRFVSALLHRLAALCVVLAERLLERTLRVLKHKTQVPRSDVQASQFLREVSAHKKELLKGSNRGAIYEE